MNIAQQTLTAEGLAHKWNKTFPVGTRCRYWTGVRSGIGKLSRTRTEAQVVGGHAVVWIEGQTGCIALSHVEPLPETKVIP